MFRIIKRTESGVFRGKAYTYIRFQVQKKCLFFWKTYSIKHRTYEDALRHLKDLENAKHTNVTVEVCK